MASNGYALAINYWKGYFPKIKTLGFLTLKNLISGETQNGDDVLQKAKLEKLLGSFLFSYQKVYDSFGVQQDMIVVYNITKKHLIQIGADFRQKKLVFGEYFETAEQYGVLLSQIKTADLSHPSLVGQVQGSMLLSIFNESPDQCEVESKGKNFCIHFLESFMVDQNQQRIKSIAHVPGNSYRLSRIFTPEMHQGFSFIHADQSEFSPKISDEDKGTIEKLNESTVNETKTLANGYQKRGMIRNILKKYKFKDRQIAQPYVDASTIN